jgi:hypothetical protein
MTTTLQDPTRQRDPSSRHAFPDVVGEPKLRAPRTLAEELFARFRGGGAASEISFELESHGGYARTVIGTVAYLDEQAQTFMVRVGDGRLMRVPLRDVTSADVGMGISSEPDGSRSVADDEGLGTGLGRTVDRTSPTARLG